MDIYSGELRCRSAGGKNEKALKFFIEHDGWIVKSIVHKMMAKYQDKQEECMNDIFLAVWKNVDRYTGEKALFFAPG